VLKYLHWDQSSLRVLTIGPAGTRFPERDPPAQTRQQPRALHRIFESRAARRSRAFGKMGSWPGSLGSHSPTWRRRSPATGRNPCADREACGRGPPQCPLCTRYQTNSRHWSRSRGETGKDGDGQTTFAMRARSARKASSRSGPCPDWVKVKNPDAPPATRVMERW